MTQQDEKYIGVKFKTIFLGDFMPTEKEKKEIKKIISIGKKFGKMGFGDKNGGNFSFRSKEGMVIKTTGSFPDKLKISDFVLVKKILGKKIWVEGRKEPSSEARFHWFIYQVRQDIQNVLHVHDRLVVESSRKIKGVGYVPAQPYGTLKLARAVKEKAKNFNYIVLKNHGVIALAKKIEESFFSIKKYHEKFKKIT